MLSSPLDAFDLAKYIDSHRHEWARDQVVRRMVWENADYITFLNRGPTPDPQYHIGPGDEIFFQHEGELHLHYLEGRTQKLRILRPGETLYLPAGVPHSPRRPEGSWSLVVERKRQPGEVDSFIWVCPHCGRELDSVSPPDGGPRDDTRATDIPPFFAVVNKRLKELGSCPGCGTALPFP